MRKVTEKTTAAFYKRTPFKMANTEVKVLDECTELRLHGNVIAILHLDDTLKITNCGWKTNTTKERLNGLLGVNICQKKGKWYLNDKEWDGSLIEV